jgi:hypothetical protein
MTTEQRLAFCNQLADTLGKIAREAEIAVMELREMIADSQQRIADDDQLLLRERAHA